ncbi:hypothetical protein Mal4_49950 [Maioricimonas rarisocia]|uniref:Uncharacterized protein n=1 Tax=Maioricimonas rarisocia TaxID=2528026 RepID=A0A517ZDS7_9PLAN|nr:hypothetical protein Mal4_49950 [Maioricimonas rarisocia]
MEKSFAVTHPTGLRLDSSHPLRELAESRVPSPEATHHSHAGCGRLLIGASRRFPLAALRTGWLAEKSLAVTHPTGLRLDPSHPLREMAKCRVPSPPGDAPSAVASRTIACGASRRFRLTALRRGWLVEKSFAVTHPTGLRLDPSHPLRELAECRVLSPPGDAPFERCSRETSERCVTGGSMCDAYYVWRCRQSRAVTLSTHFPLDRSNAGTSPSLLSRLTSPRHRTGASRRGSTSVHPRSPATRSSTRRAGSRPAASARQRPTEP